MYTEISCLTKSMNTESLCQTQNFGIHTFLYENLEPNYKGVAL